VKQQALAIALLGASTLCGCSHNYDLRFRFLTEAGSEVQLDSRSLQIPEDAIVAVELIPLDDDEIEDTEVELVPQRPILAVDRHLEDHIRVIYGIDEGTTVVDVFFGSELVFEMQATVTPRE
jgi:hypothetical protein